MMEINPNEAPGAPGDLHPVYGRIVTTDDLYRHSSALLTARERETLRYLAMGHSSEQIASLLYISKQTVDSHRKNIIHKLNVPNITAAVAYAIRHQLIV